ncbi:DUF819 family protein [Arenimonas sp. MALMAid1274]|uniref:DUF819 family protein n=1 Tax=Arenimonas sp. MALMAid1274 TaxID=3411630 RepID=UPI003B9DEBD5
MSIRPERADCSAKSRSAGSELGRRASSTNTCELRLSPPVNHKQSRADFSRKRLRGDFHKKGPIHRQPYLGSGLRPLTRTSPEIIAIASTANLRGATTAFVLAESFDRKVLVMPGILVGTSGTALGTYGALALAGILCQL